MGLDEVQECGWIAQMKSNFFVALLGGLILVAGCVGTVTDRRTVGVPFVKDKVEGLYERSPDVVFAAAKQAVSELGVMSAEGSIHGQNSEVRTIEGKVNQRKIWIRIQSADSKSTSIIVQARTSAGGTDVETAHHVEKQIAVNLATR
jgi:hypothetical protein